jgi:hypothetical protein
MGTRELLAFIFAISAVSGGLQAYSPQGVNSLLAQYGVPNAITTGLAAVNLTYSGHSYAALYRGGALYFLVNVTNANGYSFVMNSTAIYNVIQSSAASAALQQANFTRLSSQMRAYQLSSASQINDCLLETGLSSGQTCTLGNDCYSCQIVPVCRKVLTATGGANASFGLGVMAFAGQYAQLNRSFSAFYSAANGVNAANAQSKLSQLNGAFYNISNITQSIFMNPVFPPTANITADVVQNCVYYLTSASAPWYCNAVGFCANLAYNYTKLGYMQGLLNQINALPISSSQIQKVAANVSRIENLYAGPSLSAQKQALLARLLNTTLPGYAALVNNTGSLLSRVNNATLAQDLTALESSYANFTYNYGTINLTLANRTLAAQYAALKALYARVNATYSVLPGMERNSTAKLIELQISGGASPAIGNLAFEEFAINNAALSGGAGGVASLGASAAAIAQSLSSYSTGSVSLVELARYADGPFITVVASGLGLTYPEAVALAPALGALLSLIIGAAVLALVLAFRARMRRRHKVVLNSRTRRNWNIVLGCLLALILVYVLATYFLLASAGSSAPFAAFSGALGSSRQLVIAINGTPTSGEQACANAIRAALPKGSTATMATFSNGLCTAGSVTGDVNTCRAYFAGKGVPAVVLTENATPRIGVYSLYGTVLGVSGPEALMNACYVQYMVGARS